MWTLAGLLRGARMQPKTPTEYCNLVPLRKVQDRYRVLPFRIRDPFVAREG